MADSPFRRGDRVEWVGPTDNDEMGPRHGERGWVVDMDPMDDVIAWDYSATTTASLRRIAPSLRVEERQSSYWDGRGRK
jgi:hypothetical protein